METIAMLQGEYEVAARLVVTHRRASTIEAGLIRDARAAEAKRTDVEIERIAAAGATRRAKKSDPAPTPRAKRPGLGHRRAAAETARRQQQIECPGAKPAEARSCGKAQHGTILICGG
jgi:hypothetical protein